MILDGHPFILQPPPDLQGVEHQCLSGGRLKLGVRPFVYRLIVREEIIQHLDF